MDECWSLGLIKEKCFFLLFSQQNSPVVASTPAKVSATAAALFGLHYGNNLNGTHLMLHSPTPTNSAITTSMSATPTSQTSRTSRDRPAQLPPVAPPAPQSPPTMASNSSQRSASPSVLAIRRRVSDKANLPIAAGKNDSLQSSNQSMDESVNRSSNHSIKQSSHGSINQSSNQSINQSLYH